MPGLSSPALVLQPFPSLAFPSLAMARLALCLSLIFSLCLLTQARIARFPSAVSAELISEEPSFQHPVKPDYSEGVLFPLPAPNTDIFLEETKGSDAVNTVPLRRPTVMSFDLSFRPINRRLPPYPALDRRPVRLRRHGCHHRHQIRGPHVRVPYGNDMIVGAVESQRDLGAARNEKVVRYPEKKSAGEENRLRSWFWNIINGF